MSTGRVVSSGCALLAVAAGAVVVVGMAADHDPHAAQHAAAQALPTHRPAVKSFAGASSTPTPTPTSGPKTADTRSSGAAATATPTITSQVPIAVTSAPSRASSVASSVATRPATRVVTPARTTAAAVPAARPSTSSARKPAPASAHHGSSLPLHFTTGSATRVITVTAHSTGSTSATLQAWSKASGGGWTKVGSSVTAHLGSEGMSSHPSETKSATPIGSFTLTQAFGADSDPGTPLPYIHTNLRDYWISSAGPLYNTHQRCPASSPGCYDNGTNERLATETPFYNYAVVIDYNTRNAPGGVHPGRGSAFFLHVTDGNPTAGCVSIPQSRLVPIMRWLTPSSHPRILIGTT